MTGNTFVRHSRRILHCLFAGRIDDRQYLREALTPYPSLIKSIFETTRHLGTAL